MLCLGIETSCDETALALYGEGRLIAQTLASQADLHAIFGGVVPELASREHYRFLGKLFDELLSRENIDISRIDLIAVARGPGLLGSLLVGNAFAKALALALGRPVIGINHLHAHLLAAGLSQPLIFPGLGLLVSGGHTHIYRIQSISQFMQLGRSLDDAAGEAFDKIGHELGFSYPAGFEIDRHAQLGKSGAFCLPRPYLDNDNLDFSFSGLKTAAISCIQNYLQENGGWISEDRDNFCADLNLKIAETLTSKMKRALAQNPGVKAIWLAGGVAANSKIRSSLMELAYDNDKEFVAPLKRHCTDNAAMIAHAGWLLGNAGFYHDLDYEVIPRGKIMPQDMKKNLSL